MFIGFPIGGRGGSRVKISEEENGESKNPRKVDSDVSLGQVM